MKNLAQLRKKSKGITLIALVITIIVLLILAGISIASLTGESGILTKASTTKIATEQSEILEKLRLEIYYNRLDIENNLTDLEYLQKEKIIKQEIKGIVEIGKYATVTEIMYIAQTDTEEVTYYIIDIEKLIEKPETGKGDWDTGDIYYILEGNLYYMKEDQESEFLGEVYDENKKEVKWIYEENEDGSVNITGMDLTEAIDNLRNNEYDTEILIGMPTLRIPSKIEGKAVKQVDLTNLNNVIPSIGVVNYDFFHDVKIKRN